MDAVADEEDPRELDAVECVWPADAVAGSVAVAPVPEVALDTDAIADRNSRASGGAAISRDARMVRGDAPDPYTSRFASSSGLSTPPEILIPANSPFARE